MGAVAAGATPPCQRHNLHRLTGRDPFGSRPVFLFGGLLDEDACRVDDLRSEGGGSIRHHRVAARSLRTQCESTECCSPWSSGIVQTLQGVPRVVGGANDPPQAESRAVWSADPPPRAASRAAWSAAASILCGAWAPQAVFCAVIKCRILIICGNPLPQKMMCAAYRVGHL